jgi:hypothetical protein
MVRRESSSHVSVSFIEPMIFQESDCTFTAFDHRSISNNHSSRLKEKELRKGVAMPSNATLLFDASFRIHNSDDIKLYPQIPEFRYDVELDSGLQRKGQSREADCQYHYHPINRCANGVGHVQLLPTADVGVSIPARIVSAPERKPLVELMIYRLPSSRCRKTMTSWPHS